MRGLSHTELAAIETVARMLSAKWEQSSDTSDACIVVAGRRIAVDFATLKWRGASEGKVSRPGLRFDKVATRVIERLRVTVGETAPAGTTVLLTITAPIRLASKTMAALEEKIQALIGRRSPTRDATDTIHGNHVRIRLVKNESGRTPSFIGFVHNPDTDPVLLLNMTGAMLELISSEPGRRAKGLVGDRWLVVLGAGDVCFREAYRCICSKLLAATDYQQILMVFDAGRVEALTG